MSNGFSSFVFLIQKLPLYSCTFSFISLTCFHRFDAFYERIKDEGRSLLGNMQALETYPPYHEAPLLGQAPGDYQHAVQYMQSSTGHRKIGTLSYSEWEATGKYLTRKWYWNAMHSIILCVLIYSSIICSGCLSKDENNVEFGGKARVFQTLI